MIGISSPIIPFSDLPRFFKNRPSTLIGQRSTRAAERTRWLLQLSFKQDQQAFERFGGYILKKALQVITIYTQTHTFSIFLHLDQSLSVFIIFILRGDQTWRNPCNRFVVRVCYNLVAHAAGFITQYPHHVWKDTPLTSAHSIRNVWLESISNNSIDNLTMHKSSQIINWNNCQTSSCGEKYPKVLPRLNGKLRLGFTRRILDQCGNKTSQQTLFESVSWLKYAKRSWKSNINEHNCLGIKWW